MARAGKGAQFERDICRKLSKWWTKDIRDDVFWRTSISGGRATIRAKKGLQTYGAQGDIFATDPIGTPLTSFFTIELKRGYSRASLVDLLTKDHSTLLNFINQAERQRELAKTPFWMLIVKQDRQPALVFVPQAFFSLLETISTEPRKKHPSLEVLLDNYKVTVMCLDLFLLLVNSEDIIYLQNATNQEKSNTSF